MARCRNPRTGKFKKCSGNAATRVKRVYGKGKVTKICMSAKTGRRVKCGHKSHSSARGVVVLAAVPKRRKSQSRKMTAAKRYGTLKCSCKTASGKTIKYTRYA